MDSLKALSLNESLTLILAAYAAIVATFVAGWDVCKWALSGPRIALSVSGNMKVMGGAFDDPRTYVRVDATNIGDQPTTVTVLGLLWYSSWWAAYLLKRRPSAAFVTNNIATATQFPHRFEVGEHWVGMPVQDAEIEKMATSGYLFFVIYPATGRYTRARLKLNQ